MKQRSGDFFGNTRIGRRLGRRGFMLIICGVSWFLIGVSLVLNPGGGRFSSGPDESNVFLAFMDGKIIPWVWVICGATALILGATHSRSSRTPHDGVGFNAVLTPPLLWTFGYTWSAVTFFFTNGMEGRFTSWFGIIVWVLESLFILTIAGWPEHSVELEEVDVPPFPPDAIPGDDK